MLKLLLFISFTTTLFAQIYTSKLDSYNIEALMVKKLSTNELLYAKEAQKQVRPASLTKIMTALLAIEDKRLERPVTITREMTSVEPTKAGYKVGDIIFLQDLVKAAMIHSDNDAAMAVAVAVGGSVEAFVEMMNQKAKDIGMRDTHFTNPCGFDIKDHYSTPSDLLRLAEYAIKNSYFNDVTRQNIHTYYSANTNRKFVAKTHNYLLDRYSYAVGVKTGYTAKAGPCLIARAKRASDDCLIVMLNSKENRWKIAEQIFDDIFFTEETPSLPNIQNTNAQNPATTAIDASIKALFNSIKT